MTIKPSYELYRIPSKETEKVSNKLENNKLENQHQRQNQSQKQKQKVSNEKMSIPCKKTLYFFNQYNYSIPQLKIIAKNYKLKISGNKKEITKRITNYFLSEKYIILLQRFSRGYLQRKLNYLHGPAIMNRNLCTNDNDFYSLDPLNEIPYHQFFSFRDEDGFIYGFELSSIYNLFRENNYFDVENPYNRKIMGHKIFVEICNIVKLSKLLKIDIELSIEKEEPVISIEKALQLRSLGLFQFINRLGNYSSDEWFLSLPNTTLIRFVRELEDIWDYRASITPQNKLRICPPYGNPFRGINIMNLIYIEDSIKLKIFVLKIMESFVYSGRDETYQNLGAMYVLGALTIVNENAASALPWLYESFAVIGNNPDSNN